MRFVDKILQDYYIRLRDAKARDDVLLEVSKFFDFFGINTEGCDCKFDPSLNDNIVLSEDFRGFQSGTTVGDLRGSELQDLIATIIFPNVPPVYLAPFALLTSNLPSYLEVGSSTSVNFNAVFTQNDAGGVIWYKLFEGTSEMSQSPSFVIPNYTSNVPIVKSYKGTFNFAEGNLKNDSYGNPYSSGHILSGTVDTNQIQTQFLYPIFSGTISDKNNIDLNNPGFTANANKQIQPAQPSITLTMNSSTIDYLWFAVPSSVNDFTEWYVTELNNGFVGTSSDLFGAPELKQLSTSLYTNISYKLYTTNYPTQQSQPFIIS